MTIDLEIFHNDIRIRDVGIWTVVVDEDVVNYFTLEPSKHTVVAFLKPSTEKGQLLYIDKCLKMRHLKIR